MKKFILILVIGLFSLTSHAAITVKNYSDYNLDNAVKITSDFIGIGNSIMVIITSNESKLPAFTKHVSGTVYSINIKKGTSYSNAKKIIIHELVHVKQFASGRLKIVDDNHYEFDGKIHEMSGYKYHFDEPQEKEAQRIAHSIYFKYKKQLWN